MKDKKKIVIHPKDKTTNFLKKIYNGSDAVVFSGDYSHSQIFDAIANAEYVMMLGHGLSIGLLDTSWEGCRMMVDCTMVQALRGKTCIGIWCHADEFARKYKLHGLFSGMIISDVGEALDNCISATKEEIELENNRLSEIVKDCINRYDLSEIPDRIKELGGDDTPLRKFNYSNFYYF